MKFLHYFLGQYVNQLFETGVINHNPYRAIFNTPNYHQYGLSGKDIYEFAKINSHCNSSVIVKNLHYNLQNAATCINKVIRT